jgi:hypothetical protein
MGNHKEDENHSDLSTNFDAEFNKRPNINLEEVSNHMSTISIIFGSTITV